MRIFILFLTLSAFGFVIYNLPLIDYNNPLGDDSIIAVITTVCGLCVLLILSILYISKKIEKTIKSKS